MYLQKGPTAIKLEGAGERYSLNGTAIKKIFCGFPYLQSVNLGSIHGAGHREEKEEGIGTFHVRIRPVPRHHVLAGQHHGAGDRWNYAAR